MWDFHTRQLLYTFEEHDFKIEALAFSDDEKLLASIGSPEDGKLLLWDMSNGCIVASANKIPIGTTCVKFGGFVKDIKRRNTDKYQLCTAGNDGLMIWELDPYSGDMESYKLLGEVRATISRYVTDISWSDDFEFIYGATTSGDYIVASLKYRRIMQAVQATKMGLGCILYHSGGIVIGCGDSTVKFFNSQYAFQSEIRMDSPVVSLSFSPDRLEILILTAKGTINRMNIHSMQHIIISESHTGSIVAVAFAAGQNDRFATASNDGTIRVWDLGEYAVMATAGPKRDQDPGVTPTCLAFSDCLLSGWSDGRVLAHSAETGALLWFIENAHVGGVTALCLSHNRRFILTGGPAGEVRLWELRSRELISHLKEHVAKVTSLTLFNNDTVAISASRDRCILQWDLKSERRTQCKMQRMGGINSVILSQDESNMISVGQEKKLVYWGSGSDLPVYQVFLDGERDEGRCLAKSNCGRYIVTGGTMGTLRVWEYATGKTLCTATGHSGIICGVSFSPDDRQIVSVGDDGSIFIWNVFDDSQGMGKK